VILIVKDLHPMSIVDSSGFRELMAFAEPSYTMPHRSYFMGQIERIKQQSLSDLKKILSQQMQSR